MVWNKCQGLKEIQISLSPLLVRGCFSFLVTWVPVRAPSTERTLLLSFREKHVMGILPRRLPAILEKRHKTASIVEWKIVVATKQLCNLKEGKGEGNWERLSIRPGAHWTRNKFIPWVFLFYDPIHFLLTQSNLNRHIASLLSKKVFTNTCSQFSWFISPIFANLSTYLILHKIILCNHISASSNQWLHSISVTM